MAGLGAGRKEDREWGQRETEETEEDRGGRRQSGGDGMKSRRDGVHRERQRGTGIQEGKGLAIQAPSTEAERGFLPAGRQAGAAPELGSLAAR